MTGHVGTSGIMWHHAPVHVAWCFDYVCTKKPETFMKSESFGIKTKEVFACELMMAGTQGFIFVFHAWLTNYPYKNFHKLILLIGVEAGGQFTSTRAWFFKKAWLFESKRFWWKNCLLSNVLVTQPIPYVNQIQIKPTFWILLPYQSFNPRW